MTIRGPRPPAEIILDALGNNHVFSIAPAANVTLQQLTIRGGNSEASGAIQNDGTLVVERSILEDNTAAGSSRGGAISNRGGLTARDSLFRNNRGFNGGAIAADGAAGTVIERCTFVGNQTSGNSGGAIVGALLTVVNSTFTGNLTTGADRVGGAIALFSKEASASEIAFSTFTGNAATGSGGAIYQAGGITLSLRGSIVSGNSAPAGADIDALGAITGDHNVVSSPAGAVLVDGEDGNVVGTAITFAPLGDNGGLGPTLLPEDGSPSIDLVPVDRCTGLDGSPLDHDQRGAARPVRRGCDAGAVERE